MIEKMDRPTKLISIIKKNPGIQFREIMRTTGLKNGVLSHHLGKLERDGVVKAHRGPRQVRFYPLEITEYDSKIIKALRRSTPREIISSLILNEKLEFQAIVKNVERSPSTVSLYLSQLVADNVVLVKLEGRKKTYSIKDRFAVDKLIEEYHPTMVDKQAESFADTFTSL